MAGAVHGACERRTPEKRRRGEDEGSERKRPDERGPGQAYAVYKSLCVLSRPLCGSGGAMRRGASCRRRTANLMRRSPFTSNAAKL